MFVITTSGMVGKLKMAAKIRGFQQYLMKKHSTTIWVTWEDLAELQLKQLKLEFSSPPMEYLRNVFYIFFATVYI